MILNRIKELCTQKGITLTELERECGLGKSTILKWDTQSPNLGSLVKVAQTLNVSLAVLLQDDYEERKNRD